MLNNDFYQYKRMIQARRDLNAAVRSGLIERPERCQNCTGGGRIEGHHLDYGKPLQVMWLCKTCHAATAKLDHPLHHSKHQQTIGIEVCMDNVVPVTLTISLDAFAELKKACQEKHLSMSKVVESLIMNRYHTSHQLNFNFEDHGKALINANKAVSNVAVDENSLLQRKESKLQELWGERNQDISCVAC